MNYTLLNAQFIQVMDANFLYEIQSGGESVQQYKKAFFFAEIQTEQGRGVFILHASCNEEKEFTKFLVEHHHTQQTCCACGVLHDEVDVYCLGFTQDSLRYLFEHVQQHPNVKDKWAIEKLAL